MQVDLFSLLRMIFAAFGLFSACVLVIAILTGLLPALYRLGRGLSGKKVALFASGDRFDSLKNVLTDSKLFKEKNIIAVKSRDNLSRCEPASVFVVYWSDWSEHIEDIIGKKADSTALLIYAPQIDGFIPKDVMARLELERNVVVTNFRGRLINDLIVAMMATAYEKK